MGTHRAYAESEIAAIRKDLLDAHIELIRTQKVLGHLMSGLRSVAESGSPSASSAARACMLSPAKSETSIVSTRSRDRDFFMMFLPF